MSVEHHDRSLGRKTTLVASPDERYGGDPNCILPWVFSAYFVTAIRTIDRPMTVCAVVACDRHGLIGVDSLLPWNCPEDLHHFKQLTLGKKVLLGRSTFEGIVEYLGSPLPERQHVVLTHRAGKKFENVAYESVLDIPRFADNGDLYVIGGASVYAQCALQFDVIYLSLIKGNYCGNVYLPDLGSDWFLEQSEDRGSFFLLVLRRKPKDLSLRLFLWEDLETFQP